MGTNTKHHSNVLIVEGNDDKHSVIQLMAFHTPWPDDQTKCPVYIEVGNGVEQILEGRFLDVWLRSPGLRTFGILLDEDDNVGGRYQRIWQLCSPRIAGMPDVMPPEGLIVKEKGGPRFGVWIMPDNGSDGMLEDFVRQSVEEADQAALLSAAVTVVGKLDKPLFDRKRHLSKAEVATWLAWQKIPGKGIESAAGDGLIKLNAPLVSEFNAWLKRTF